jgi:2-phospho-L-lactate/phosphoenolpyruvate guanylyltransferase
VVDASDAVVLVPVKAFSQAKKRLSPVLNPAERASLARRMAEHVVKAAAPLPVAVVCDDEEVAAWAAGMGAWVLPEPGRGLNGAVAAAVESLAAQGVARAVVAHGDLPRAHGLAALALVEGIALVPDRRRDGTNVISTPTGTIFRFSYGPGSFERHRAAAQATGLPVEVVDDPDLAWDIDFPADMAALGRPQP